MKLLNAIGANRITEFKWLKEINRSKCIFINLWKWIYNIVDLSKYTLIKSLAYCF